MLRLEPIRQLLKLCPRPQPSASSNCRSSPLAPARCRLSRRYRKHIAYTLRSSPRSRASGVRSAPSCLFPALSWVISSNETNAALSSGTGGIYLSWNVPETHSLAPVERTHLRYDPPPQLSMGTMVRYQGEEIVNARFIFVSDSRRH